jgi:hypothetical protein
MQISEASISTNCRNIIIPCGKNKDNGCQLFTRTLEEIGTATRVLFPLLGIPTGDVLIFAHRRVMRTDTIFNVVRQIAYIHGREFILLEIRERIQKYM